MMNSDTKTLLPSLINEIKSDLYAFDNITESVTLSLPNANIDTSFNDRDIDATDEILAKWNIVINMIPLEYRTFIENYPDMYTIEEFDERYIHNPKLCSYERYGTTNMWRPLMVLNKCSSITRFDFKYIKYYNITVFSKVLSVLISRIK